MQWILNFLISLLRFGGFVGGLVLVDYLFTWVCGFQLPGWSFLFVCALLLYAISVLDKDFSPTPEGFV